MRETQTATGMKIVRLWIQAHALPKANPCGLPSAPDRQRLGRRKTRIASCNSRLAGHGGAVDASRQGRAVWWDFEREALHLCDANPSAAQRFVEAVDGRVVGAAP